MIRDVFVDTGPWIAHLYPRDRNHGRAAAWFQEIAESRNLRLWTSDYVMAETLNFIRRRLPRQSVADRFVEATLGSSRMPPVVHEVLRVHGARFAEALALYRARFDQGLSLTDWTNVVLMREHRIPEIATFDAGFAGLVELTPGLRP